MHSCQIGQLCGDIWCINACKRWVKRLSVIEEFRNHYQLKIQQWYVNWDCIFAILDSRSWRREPHSKQGTRKCEVLSELCSFISFDCPPFAGTSWWHFSIVFSNAGKVTPLVSMLNAYNQGQEVSLLVHSISSDTIEIKVNRFKAWAHWKWENDHLDRGHCVHKISFDVETGLSID